MKFDSKIYFFRVNAVIRRMKQIKSTIVAIDLLPGEIISGKTNFCAFSLFSAVIGKISHLSLPLPCRANRTNRQS